MSSKKTAAKKPQPKLVTHVERTELKAALPKDPRPDLKQPQGGKVGRSKRVFLKDKYVPWATALAREGLNKKQIATQMRLGKTLFYEWVRDHSEFANALEEGHSEAVARVENALFARAVGLDVEESKIIGRPQLGTDPQNEATYKKPLMGADGKPIISPERVERVKKHVVGDVQAQHIFLKANKPEKYRENLELTGPKGEPLVPRQTIMAVLGTEEFRKMDAAVREKLAAKAAQEEAKT